MYFISKSNRLHLLILNRFISSVSQSVSRIEAAYRFRKHMNETAAVQRPVSVIQETLRGGGLALFPKNDNYTYFYNSGLALITYVKRKHV